MIKKKNWIQDAIKHPGALTAKAKATGKSISQLCSGNVNGTTVKQCALAKTLKKMRKGG